VLIDLEDLPPDQPVALVDPAPDLLDLPLSLFAVVQILLDLSHHVAKSQGRHQALPGRMMLLGFFLIGVTRLCGTKMGPVFTG